MTATERRYAGQCDNILRMVAPAINWETSELLSSVATVEWDPPIWCDDRIVTIAGNQDEVAE